MYVMILSSPVSFVNVTFIKFVRKFACTYNSFIFITVYKPLYNYSIIY